MAPCYFAHLSGSLNEEPFIQTDLHNHIASERKQDPQRQTHTHHQSRRLMQRRIDLKLILLGLALANAVFSQELRKKLGFLYCKVHHNLRL